MARIGVLINPLTNIDRRKPAFTSLSRRLNTPIPCAISAEEPKHITGEMGGRPILALAEAEKAPKYAARAGLAQW
jgi:hypothetical protein